MRKIILITGGQRSGKSQKAEEMALALSPNPVYVATAHVWDDEFRERVRKHQERRGPEWTNIEEEMYLSRHDVSGRVVLIDCCTLWATNFFFYAATGEDNTAATEEDNKAATEEDNTAATTDACPDSKEVLPDVQPILDTLKEEFDRFTSQDATFIFVTNEIGLGGVSSNAVQRRFTDLLGWLNQYIASKADEVILMISGRAVKI